MTRLAALVLAFSLPTAAVAQTAAPAASATFDVVRPGDSQLTCAALISEMNILNAEISSVQTGLFDMSAEISQQSISSAQTSMASNAAMSLGGLVASMIPGAGLALGAAQMLGAAGQQAQMQAQQARTLAQMADVTAQTTEAASRLVPLEQRVDHLSALSRAKSC